MKDIKEVNWQAQNQQLNNDVLRRHRDEDIRDDDAITSDRVSDSRLPGSDADETPAKLNDDLRRTDLDDDDEINADLHSVKNDQFGSLATETNSNPNPAEVPAENQPNKQPEVTQPRKDNMEQGKQNESDFKHTKEVTPPQPEHERKTTTDSVQPPNIGVDHPRTTERIVDHEPGVAGDRRAPNL